MYWRHPLCNKCTKSREKQAFKLSHGGKSIECNKGYTPRKTGYCKFYDEK